MMPAWVWRLEAWLMAVPWLPKCLREMIREILADLLHMAAVSFGITFCFLSIWDVCVEHHGFNAVSFGGGALSIMTGWATAWWLKPNGLPPIPLVPAATPIPTPGI